MNIIQLNALVDIITVQNEIAQERAKERNKDDLRRLN